MNLTRLRLFKTTITALLFASQVQADANCGVSVTSIAFGSYDIFVSEHNTSTGNISVTCTGGSETSTASYNIKLSSGNSGNFSQRQLRQNSYILNYNLYTNPSYSIIWGDNSGDSGMVQDSFSLSTTTVTKDYTVYGLIPAAQNRVYIGNYTDTIIVTVDYQ